MAPAAEGRGVAGAVATTLSCAIAALVPAGPPAARGAQQPPPGAARATSILAAPSSACDCRPGSARLQPTWSGRCPVVPTRAPVPSLDRDRAGGRRRSRALEEPTPLTSSG